MCRPVFRSRVNFGMMTLHIYVAEQCCLKVNGNSSNNNLNI